MDIEYENKTIAYLNFGTGLNIPFMPWTSEQLQFAETRLDEFAKNSCCCSCFECQALYELERLIDRFKTLNPPKHNF